MSRSFKTTFDVRCDVLADVWAVNEEGLEAFYLEHEVAFALAFAISKGFAEATDEGQEIIDDLWEAQLELIGMEDTGFKSTEELDEAVVEKYPETYVDNFFKTAFGEDIDIK